MESTIDRIQGLRRLRKIAVAVAVGACLMSPAEAQAQKAPEIWFSPEQDSYDPALKAVSWAKYDFLSMIPADSPWQRSSRYVSAFGYGVVHTAERFGWKDTPSVADFHTLFARTAPMVIGGGSIIYTSGLCDGNVEGMTNDPAYAREVVAATRKWHDAGLPMEYFTMDGPFYFGYIYSQGKCHFSIDDVARRAATTMNLVRQLYPNIKVVDAEGPGSQLPAQWLPEYHKFLAAFRAAYGAPIDYLSMDLHYIDTWHTGYNWVSAAKEIADDVHAQGMKVALIVNADDRHWDPDVAPLDPAAPAATAMTEEYWLAAVRKHIDLIKEKAIPVDAVHLNSWMKYPARNLPETDPRAWTNMILYAHDVLGVEPVK